MEFDLHNKKTNIAVTSVILAVALAIFIIVSCQFTAFSKFVTYFNTTNVDETQKFAQYSPTLAGTAGDADIFIMNGKDNTVALVKTENAEKFSTLDGVVGSDKIVAVASSAQLTAAKQTIASVIEEVATPSSAVEKVKNGQAEVAVLSYAQASEAVKADAALSIAKAEVEKVPKLLILGGTHPNEPAGQLAATLFLENARVDRGVLYVVTETNRSAYTHSMPQEGTTWYYDMTTKNGQTRTFKFGARPTNTNEQWPNPDVYVHSSGQNLSSSEVRNINRAYPGSATGNYTERVAYAVAELIRENDITMVIDLHEAAPEYITINAMVCHQDSADIGANARLWYLDDYQAVTQKGDSYTAPGGTVKGVKIKVEDSPMTLHGLTHRELGDYTNAYAFLLETSNASQGKLRGGFNEDLITYASPDKFYEYAASIDGLLWARPVSINERVARHVMSICSIVDSFNDYGVTRDTKSTKSVNKLPEEQKQSSVHVGSFKWGNIPKYVEILDNGVGYYLADPV